MIYKKLQVPVTRSELERLQKVACIVITAALRTTQTKVLISLFNQEQLLLETLFSKMDIERDICKNLIFKFILGAQTPTKKAPGGGRGFNMMFRTSFSNISHTQTFVGSFCYFFPHFDLICLDYSLNTLFQANHQAQARI